MDELERRLSSGLRSNAAQAPHFDGDYAAVHRRGRNRRWAVRGGGLVGLALLLGAGALALNAQQTEEPLDLATEFTPAVVTPTPTPESTPTPQPTVIVVIPTAPVVVTVDPPDPTAASLLVATGWGVGLVKPTGDLYTPVVCCEDDELRWWSQPDDAAEGIEVEQGAVTVRDDLQGGFVSASQSALFWTPDPFVSQQRDPILITVAATAADQVEGVAGGNEDQADAPTADEAAPTAALDLWDVAVIDTEIQVLYSTYVVNDQEAFEGTATLAAVVLDANGGETTPRVLEEKTWSGEAEFEATYEGAAWLPGGGWMALKSRDQGACSWVELRQPDGAESGLVSPFPKPADVSSCHPSTLAAATADEAGALLAVSERTVEGDEHLGLYNLTDGSQVNLVDLPDAADGQGAWSEMDMASSWVVVSRGDGMDPQDWPSLDETVLVGVDADTPSPIGFIGSPSLPRSTVSTAGLDAVDIQGPLWFGVRVPADQSEPDAEADPEKAGTDPQPAETSPESEPDTAPVTIDPKDRKPVGPLVNIVAAGTFPGTDGCLGTAEGGVCVGWELDQATVALNEAFGSEARTEDPSTFVEGERHPEGVHVWADDARRVSLDENSALVTRVDSRPETPAGLVSPFERSLTVGTVLDELGPPAEVFRGDGEGTSVLTLSYDTTEARVHYSYLEFWGDDTRLDVDAGGLATVPERYDDLSITAFRAQPAS